MCSLLWFRTLCPSPSPSPPRSSFRCLPAGVSLQSSEVRQCVAAACLRQCSAPSPPSRLTATQTRRRPFPAFNHSNSNSNNNSRDSNDTDSNDTDSNDTGRREEATAVAAMPVRRGSAALEAAPSRIGIPPSLSISRTPGGASPFWWTALTLTSFTTAPPARIFSPAAVCSQVWCRPSSRRACLCCCACLPTSFRQSGSPCCYPPRQRTPPPRPPWKVVVTRTHPSGPLLTLWPSTTHPSTATVALPS